MKIKTTARGYEATVTIPVVSIIPAAIPDDDGSGEAPVVFYAPTKTVYTFDRASGTWAAGGGSSAGALLAANNLSDLVNAASARGSLGLGSLATQSGTFSGTSSGANTGDQTFVLTGAVTGSGVGTFATTLAVQVTQTVMGNGSGSTASPTALALTNANQIVATASALVSTFVSGVAGGQTLTFGAGAGDNAIYSSTSNLVKGKHIFGSTSGVYIDEAANSGAGAICLGLGATANAANQTLNLNLSVNGNHAAFSASNPSSGTSALTSINLSNAINGASGAGFSMNFYGGSHVGSGALVPGTIDINIGGGTGNIVIGVRQSTGDIVFNTLSSRTERMRVLNAGSVTIGTGLATTATDGDLYVNSCAGTPTGVPTTLNSGNSIPLRIDRTAGKAYIFVNAAWAALN